MIGSLLKRYMRHWRDETGSAAVEFVIVFPVMATMIVMTLELGFITLRQTMLERGLDMAVREVRLGTGQTIEYEDVKDLICENSMIFVDCENQMYLEMINSDPRAFAALHPIAVCSDQPIDEQIRPVKSFTPGQANEVVMMRACLNYTPLFPEALLGGLLTKDSSGDAAILAVTAFVQEPE